MNYKIKQQKQIEKFLIQEFGTQKGIELFEKETEILAKIIDNTNSKTSNQMKTLMQVILPRIALYKAFSSCGYSIESTYKYVRKYMIEVIANKKHKSTAAMEIVPFFFYIYRFSFLKIMRSTDLQLSTQKSGKGFYDITISKCLWHTACVENNCSELCKLFCDVDDVTYGGLKKIGFSRTQTLGYGGSCCDFHFFKK